MIFAKSARLHSALQVFRELFQWDGPGLYLPWALPTYSGLAAWRNPIHSTEINSQMNKQLPDEYTTANHFFACVTGCEMENTSLTISKPAF